MLGVEDSCLAPGPVESRTGGWTCIRGWQEKLKDAGTE